MGEFHWYPDSYLALMHEELPDYERLQDETTAAVGTEARRLLELGTGTGETARRVLARNPAATLLGLDASREMLDHAAAALPAARVELRVADVADQLPDGPFDVVLSALTIHHLDGPGKADLFQRVADVLAPGSRFVLGDVVVPQDPADVVTPIDPDYDKPSTVADQLRWLSAAGLRARLAWAHCDLAVLVGQAPPALP
jgi:tRNA (cmo5U34)-methyltransferase